MENIRAGFPCSDVDKRKFNMVFPIDNLEESIGWYE